MELIAKKTPIGFEVLSQDVDKLFKLKNGEMFKVKVVRPRNLNFHRKFFGMLRLAFDNQEVYEDFDVFEEVIKLGIHHVSCFYMPNGYPCYKSKSISFAKMSQDEFEEFYEKAGRYIEREFKIEWEDLSREAEEV